MFRLLLIIAATEIFVSPNGSDNAAGTLSAPLRTLMAARNRARIEKRADQPVAVRLRGGEYHLAETLVLGPEDAGVEWTAWRDERPVLTGGRRIDGFIPYGTNGCLVADVRKCGYRGFEPPPPAGFSESEPKRPEIIVRRINALFFNGIRLSPAQYPDDGHMLHADEIVSQKRLVIRSKKLESTLELSPDIAPDLFIHGYPDALWADENRPCRRLADGSLAITWPRAGRLASGFPFVLKNALAFVDHPGEWYLERATGKLYVMPPVRSRGECILAETAVPFIAITNAANLRISGLVFEYSRGDAVIAIGADKFDFTGNVIRNIGGIGLNASGSGINIEGNIFRSIGFDAIRLAGGDRSTLTPAGSRIADNDISDTGHGQHTYVPGALVYGCGTEIVRNHFHDMPSSAMRLEGNDHLIHSNLVERVVRESDDQGASDTFGGPSFGGITFRHNVWRSIRTKGVGATMACAIRFDDCVSNMIVEGNRFEDASDGRFGSVQINMGRYNLVTNNLIIGGSCAVSFTDADRPDKWRGFLKYCYRAPGIYGKVDATREPWRSRYPWLMDPLNTVCTNTIVGNVVVGTRNGAVLMFATGDIAETDNTVFKTMPDEATLLKIPGFTLPPKAEDVGPDPRNRNYRRARRNDLTD